MQTQSLPSQILSLLQTLLFPSEWARMQALPCSLGAGQHLEVTSPFLGPMQHVENPLLTPLTAGPCVSDLAMGLVDRFLMVCTLFPRRGCMVLPIFPTAFSG